ncbi:22208_t:CDS:1 [Dentiscutata erythropus]|uniref:22208_t:CDS:1 n=1 Tax=Dentiscutata erythropus TaxID=1348616 RepID=A0A9N9H559_9GLOM|nr:22208_t:CDS:1 [Dentiscutata erythropus]
MGQCISQGQSEFRQSRNTLQARGEFLGSDLRVMFNNPVYSDIIITCKDGGVLYGSKLLLAARSDIFANMFLKSNNDKNATKNEDSISFPEFNSKTILMILEYLYMGNITMETLTLNNVVEAYFGAEYFLLPQLEDIVISFLDNALKCSADNTLAAKFLTQATEFMSPSTDDILYRTLHKCLIVTPLETVNFGILNQEGLQFILSPKGIEDEEFATSEYGVFRYILLWAANKISKDVVTHFESLLPTSDQAEHLDVLQLDRLRRAHEINHYKSKELYESIFPLVSPLLKCVDFKLIHPSILANIIEPLDFVPSEFLIDAFRYQTKLPPGVGPKRNRGVVTAKPGNLKLQWDQYAHGPNIFVLENNTVLRSRSKKSEFARTTLPIRGRDLYEWDIIIEEDCKYIWIGVCTERRFEVNYSNWLGGEIYGYTLGSNGSLAHNRGPNNEKSLKNSISYGSKFGKNSCITVHLDMGSRTLSFSINGIKYGSAFTDLPREVYPAVSLKKPGKVRIGHHDNPISMAELNSNELVK